MLRRCLGVVLALSVGCGGVVDVDAMDGAGGGGAGGTGSIASSTIDASVNASVSNSVGIGSVSSSSGGPVDDILDYLGSLPGVTVDDYGDQGDGYRFFVLGFQQLADHDDPGGQTFIQRATLLHIDTAAPMVLESTGYGIVDYPYLDEPAALLAGNQLLVEHRFFTPSRPDPADWNDLNIAQAAADHHHIVELLKPAYTAPWISTGVSKGGMTSMYHRRFYPDDVAGTVAYVAPQSYGMGDPRYVDFLAQVGDPSCRQALKTLQVELLARRDAMMQRVASQGYVYSYLGMEEAFEGAVVFLPWAFWQYQYQDLCSAVPSPSASDDELWGFLDAYNGVWGWADDTLLYYEPYYWQVQLELGDGGVDISYLDLLHPEAITTPSPLPSANVTPVFDASALLDVASWLAGQGERILWIYGQNDPYSAGAFDPSGVVDGHRFYEAGGNHLSNIAGLAGPDQEEALEALQAWTGVQLQPVQVRAPGSPDARRMAWFRDTQRRAPRGPSR